MKKIVMAAFLGCLSATASADLESVGAWSTKTETNKMTDETDYVALNTSSDKYSKDGLSRDTTLVLRCDGNKTDAYLSFDDFMGSRDPVVTMRLDGGKPTKKTWNGGEGGDAAFAPQAIQLIKELSKHKKAIFGFEPYGSTMQVVEFDLTGIDKVAEKLARSCKWK
ncbi:type VI secretion protein [Enterobacter kobei]|uniref:type VI secretion system-associated protein TagO n=1 Tax=Enterobacter kobei TaxID=208224 RepID=UPI00200545E3|nr:type VI secretion system-associated protein TagO [Enterobacter kobei]MCK7194588.1 type VI secretion protein [Enterobacter kobei]